MPTKTELRKKTSPATVCVYHYNQFRNVHNMQQYQKKSSYSLSFQAKYIGNTRMDHVLHDLT